MKTFPVKKKKKKEKKNKNNKKTKNKKKTKAKQKRWRASDISVISVNVVLFHFPGKVL